MWHMGRTFINQADRDVDVRLTWPLLRRVFGYFVPYWRHALVVLVCIIAGSTVSLVPAFVTKTLIDTALKPGADYKFVVLVVSAGVAAALFDGLLGVLQSYMRNLISEGIMFDLRNQLFNHLLKQSVAFFTKSRTGDVMSRIQNDVNAVQSVVSDTIFNLISNVFMLLGTLGGGGPAILWLVGGYLVVTGHASVGTVVTFATGLLGRLDGPASSLASLHVNVIGSLAVFQRIFEYLDLPVEIADAPDAVELGEAQGALAFDGVTFSYTGKGRPALERVDFSVEPGQLVALVGPSGAGKTTVTSLIPRFYDPQKGVVRLDGHDIRKLTLESLGKQIGIVFQDTFLFHASVRDNLLYARPDATEEEIVAAARAANIHDFIESLPDAYNTLVGERGHRLSGGEKQRIAIARV